MKKREYSFFSESHIEYTCKACGLNQTQHTGELCKSCKEKEAGKQKLSVGTQSQNTCSICSGTGHNPFNDNLCTFCDGTGKVIIKYRQKLKSTQLS